MSVLDRLDPRQHLSAAVGWAVFAVVTVAALVTADFAARQAEARARVDAETLLAEYATQVRDAVSMQVQIRRSVLDATAVTMQAPAAGPGRRASRFLAEIRARFPEFSLLMVVASGGLIMDASDAMRVGKSIDAEAWQRLARQEPVTRLRAHDAAASPALPEGVYLSVPIGEAGVLVAGLPLSWLGEQVSRMQDAFSRTRPAQVLLTARDGSVLFGPDAWRGRSVATDDNLSDDGAYLVGRRASLRLADGMGLGWTAIVRQQVAIALDAARATRTLVFAIVFLAGVMAATLAAAATQVLMRPVARLARDAEAIRTGQAGSLAVPSGRDDVARIGAALSKVVDHLQSEKAALQRLNAELDQRVGERTRRIERMAAETRQAAVTRERLRMARDLHDTLAHSLMALLTQIRLVRKLGPRMAPADLDAELERAEVATTTGLAEARAAITAMRSTSVRDTGLAQALQAAADRLRERNGIEIQVISQVEPNDMAAALVDDRAETAFRVVEEALRNIERHARASQVQVALTTKAQPDGGIAVRLTVTDDGVGFDPGADMPGHFGLRGMKEQAELIGARLVVASRVGAGTCVELEFEG